MLAQPDPPENGTRRDMSSIGVHYRRSGAVSPGRLAAFDALLSLLSSEDTIEEVLERARQSIVSDLRDRSLAMELVFGVLRRQEAIDWRLAPLLKRPLPRLPIAVQTLLRLGTYQLLYLERVPPSAAVDQTVSHAKLLLKTLGRDWSGFVNAVLRNLIRLPMVPLPDPNLYPEQALSIRHSVPQWICRRWIQRMGFERAEAACLSMSCVPPITLRVNQLRLTRESFLERLQQQGISARPTAISPVGVSLDKGQEITSIPGFHEGAFYVEDEAAQLIPRLLDPQPGDLILDACAAPGGKTTHLAELMSQQGRILAVDRQQARLELLQENCGRLGHTIVTSFLGDARNPAEVLHSLRTGPIHATPTPVAHGGLVDRILLDAPCSGLGVLRRHPEAKRKKHTAMFSRHQDLQKEILEAVSVVLRPGGVLVYSTCSTEPEETEDVVAQFCRVHPGWIREPVTPWIPPAALPYVTAQGALSTLGNKCGMDGFYAVRLRKVS